MRKLGNTLGRPMAFLFRRMARYPGLIALVVLTMLLTTAGNIAIPYLVRILINNYILRGDLPGLLRILQFLLHKSYALPFECWCVNLCLEKFSK